MPSRAAHNGPRQTEQVGVGDFAVAEQALSVISPHVEQACPFGDEAAIRRRGSVSQAFGHPRSGPRARMAQLRNDADTAVLRDCTRRPTRLEVILPAALVRVGYAGDHCRAMQSTVDAGASDAAAPDTQRHVNPNASPAPR